MLKYLYNDHCQLEEYIMKNDLIIITQPNLTCLYTGQIISKTTLPQILKENFVSENEIEFVPYTKTKHLSIVKKSYSIYPHLTKKDFNKIY